MKIIFLDFDGVLNSSEHMATLTNESLSIEHKQLDRKAVGRLNWITDEMGAKIVISSTWRILHKIDELKEFLKMAGCTGQVIGVTPKLGKHRGLEIKQWLDEHPNVESFVILDDDSDMDGVMEHLVKTEWKLGLQDEHVKLAIKMLSQKSSMET